MKYLIRQSILTLLNLFSGGLASRSSIIMYHSICNDSKFFTVSPTQFEIQMTLLKKSGYVVVSLRELVQRLRTGKSIAGMVVITFDDGYRDNYTQAFPALKHFNFPATIFLTTSRINKDTSMLSKNEIKEMSESGLIDFMPHTVNHLDLSKAPLADAKREIDESRAFVESLTGKTADVFAYPKGRYTKEIVEYLRNSDAWVGAVTVETGLVHSGNDTFLLKRNSVDSWTNATVFKAYLSVSTEYYSRVKQVFLCR